MHFRCLSGLLIIFPFFSYAGGAGCAATGAAIEQQLFDSITNGLNITPDTIVRNKTIVTVLNTSPVSELFASQLADEDSDNNGAKLPKGEYFYSYYGNGAKNITAKYTYTNHDNKKDVFIASGLVNNDECSVRFNGYLIISREF
ncbi:Shiga toxin A subunit [Salmonella enterica]